EVLGVVGSAIHGHAFVVGQGSAAAERWLAASALWQGVLHVFRVCVAPRAAAWRCRRISTHGKFAIADGSAPTKIDRSNRSKGRKASETSPLIPKVFFAFEPRLFFQKRRDDDRQSAIELLPQFQAHD